MPSILITKMSSYKHAMESGSKRDFGRISGFDIFLSGIPIIQGMG